MREIKALGKDKWLRVIAQGEQKFGNQKNRIRPKQLHSILFCRPETWKMAIWLKPTEREFPRC
jgi:hypothetical protein